MSGKTLLSKIWDRHVVMSAPDGRDLLFVDRHFVHDGCSQAFERLDMEGHSVHRPDLTIAMPDHYVPTKGGADGFFDDIRRNMPAKLQANAEKWGLRHFAMGSERHGIVHVVGPELGLVLPGMLVVCGDSHTSTHGALGTIAFGIGATEIAHVLATQTLWQRKPKSMRLRVDGCLALGVTAKDMILSMIAAIGADGGTGHMIEYAGQAIRDLSIEGRLTLCNMSIEAGARGGFVAPDDKTIAYLRNRTFSPTGSAWTQAMETWQSLKSDDNAEFDCDTRIDGASISPVVTWGTSPEDAQPVTGRIPDPNAETDADRRARMVRALDYMDLKPSTPIQDIRIDRVFIGSCTNSRIEDLRAAAGVLKGRKVSVPTLVVPGSAQVKSEAEREGLDRVFTEAGAEWRDPGCSMCVGMNRIDVVGPGERCASTSNRNFAGRQGKGARTHLMSPAMAAAAAIRGRVTDVRDLLMAH